MKFVKYIFLFSLTVFFASCELDSVRNNDAGTSETAATDGKAGSYARFAVVGDFMYVVDNADISTFGLSDPTAPVLVDEKRIGEDIESIYTIGNRIFIGASSGLYTYTIDANGIPQQAGTFSYDFPITPCDPVVADDNYAYVTLSSANPGPCGGTNMVNQLNVFNVQDIDNPELLASYEMSNPKGVGLDGNTLFVCDDFAGLKVYDVSNPNNVQLIKHFEDIVPYDVITLDGLLLVVSPTNVYQYDYTDLDNIKRVSEILVAS